MAGFGEDEDAAMEHLLADFGLDTSSFDRQDREALWRAGYRKMRDLMDARHQGLNNAGLRSARTDNIIHAQDARRAQTVEGGACGGAAGGVAATTGAAAGLGLGRASGAGAAGVGRDLREALFPSSLYTFTFTLYNGSRVVTTLVSHAKALRFRGEVRHVSAARSDFTLLLSAAGESNEQKLLSFARWLEALVPVHKPTAGAKAPGSSTAEVEGAHVEVTSDLINPRTSDRALLDLYRRGALLSVRATAAVQLELERAVEAAEQEERLSQCSKSSASSAHD